MRNLRDINRIVTFGDSITFGMSASSQDRCWSSLVASMLERFRGEPIKLFNQGVGASILCRETPAYQHAANPCGLERLQRDVIDKKPNLLIIAYGLNDSRGGTSTEVFRGDYQEMIERIRAKIDPMIVVLNTYYMHESIYRTCENWNYSNYDLAEEYNLVIRQLSEKNGLVYVDAFGAQKGVEWSVSEDHCHPNDLGHLLIANRIFEAIASNCVFDV